VIQIWVVLSLFWLGVFRSSDIEIMCGSAALSPPPRHERTVAAAVGQCHGAGVVNSEWGTITDPRLVRPTLSDEEWMKVELAAVA
jgi:hypothetical protein